MPTPANATCVSIRTRTYRDRPRIDRPRSRASIEAWNHSFRPALTGHPQSRNDRLRLAALAYLDRYKGQSRDHAASDLRGYLSWCADRDVHPLAATRVQIELWVRWMQETRGLRPATVSRRVSVMAGFYRTCVVDDVLERSPAEFVRRPRVPAESATLGFTHLQFEALLAAGRDSANRHSRGDNRGCLHVLCLLQRLVDRRRPRLRSKA
jgi:hypothetical protein